MRKAVLSSALLLLAVSFLPAHAAPSSGVNLYALGHSASVLGEVDMAVVGLGGKITLVPNGSTNKSISVGFEYGQGMNKNSRTDAGDPKYTNELDLSELAVLLEMNHYFDCCDDAFYCGPTLYYSNQSLTVKNTGDDDIKYTGITTFGIGARLGRGFALGKSVRAQGEFRDVLGYSTWSGTQGSAKLEWSAWRFIPSATVGLVFTFGK